MRVKITFTCVTQQSTHDHTQFVGDFDSVVATWRNVQPMLLLFCSKCAAPMQEERFIEDHDESWRKVALDDWDEARALHVMTRIEESADEGAVN
jgi:hypothetical protein